MKTNFLKTIFFLFLIVGITSQVEAQCTFNMGPLTVTHGNGQVTMSGPASNYHYQVFDISNNYSEIYNCQYCGSSETVSGLSNNGNYLLRVTNESWTTSWDESINLGASPCNSNPCETTNGPITVSYGDGEIEMSGTGSQYHYQVFDKNNNYSEIYNCQYCGSSQTLSNLSDSDYLVRVTAGNWSTSWDLHVSLPCSSNREIQAQLEDDFDQNSVTLYPNPTQDVLYVEMDGFSEEKGQLSIYNALGQEVHQQEIGGNDYLEIDASNFNVGMYYMLIRTEKTSITKQFIVAK